MALLSPIAAGILLLVTGLVLHPAFRLLHNYLAARKIGLPIRIIPFDHNNPIWMVCDRLVLRLVRRLPFGLGDNSLTRYNYRGWEVPDRYFSHHELGDAFIMVSPANLWLYVADPDTVTEIWRRGKDFPRDVSITAILDVFGPNISTAQGAQWQKHRRITASSFNDSNNVIVWSESVAVASDVLRYWTSKPSVVTTADDLRTLSLHVMSRAGFGKSFKFQGEEEHAHASATDRPMNYKEALRMILENCVLMFALGTKRLANPWLPKKFRRLHEACLTFQKHMTEVYEEEKRTLAQGASSDRNFMSSLVRASQDETAKSSPGGLTESEIYGNMFVFNFAGHDTTAHTFTFALYFLAAHPATQDWLCEEIRRVRRRGPGRAPRDCSYADDFPRLKRCLAVMYETLRLYTPVPTLKLAAGPDPQPLTVGGGGQKKTVVLLPPGTVVMPSYAALQTDPRYWGADSLAWRPSRFIKRSVAAAGQRKDDDDDEEFLAPARGTYLPWSGGARDCVGRRFSQVEFVAVVATLFADWRVRPAPRAGETAAAARRRVLHQIERDSAPVLLLQMLHPERCPLVWSKRE
ncbi:cytochrome P450 [Xylariomycetidae sp. FL0641]|nr:cytochrome P450 [Xylariomycetidae sp. FL0641]